MGWGNSGTRNPNAPCPPNNPHCQGLEPPGVSIDMQDVKYIIFALAVLFGCFLIWKASKRVKYQQMSKFN